MDETIWKTLVYQGVAYNNIEISNFGQFRNSKTHYIYKTYTKQGEYDRVGISLGSKNNQKTFYVHKAIAETFIPNPDNKPQVNHIDGNKQNNAIENLEWATISENTLHAFVNGLYDVNKLKGVNNHEAKLTNEEVVFIRTHYIPYDHDYGTYGLARRFKVGEATIWRIVNNKSYTNI